MDHASAVMTFVLETLKWPKVSWTPTRFGGGSRTLLLGGLTLNWGGRIWKKMHQKDGEELWVLMYVIQNVMLHEWLWLKND